MTDSIKKTDDSEVSSCQPHKQAGTASSSKLQVFVEKKRKELKLNEAEAVLHPAIWSVYFLNLSSKNLVKGFCSFEPHKQAEQEHHILSKTRKWFP